MDLLGWSERLLTRHCFSKRFHSWGKRLPNLVERLHKLSKCLLIIFTVKADYPNRPYLVESPSASRNDIRAYSYEPYEICMYVRVGLLTYSKEHRGLDENVEMDDGN